MMKSPAFSRRALLRSLLAATVLGLPGMTFADATDSNTSVLRQEVAGLTLILRLPTAGIVAGQESVLSMRIERKNADGEMETLPFARIDASAQTAPDAKPVSLTPFPGGVSGEYSLVGTFPDAGTYTLTTTITPNGGKEVKGSFTGIIAQPATDKKEKQEPAYSLKMEAIPAQPLPGELVNLRFFVENDKKKRVTEFDQIYDAPMHLYILREDINELHHEKPAMLTDAPGRKDDGVFALSYTFATGGTWRIFAEIAPLREGAQILTTKLTVPGARALPEPLMAPVSPIVQQSGITMKFERPVRLIAKETAILPLRLTDSQGQALSDLQFDSGALAHLYFADKNGTFLHCLPDTSDPRTGRAGSNIIAFPVRFPRSGTYRAWLNFVRGTQSYKLSFVVKVYDK